MMDEVFQFVTTFKDFPPRSFPPSFNPANIMEEHAGHHEAEEGADGRPRSRPDPRQLEQDDRPTAPAARRQIVATSRLSRAADGGPARKWRSAFRRVPRVQPRFLPKRSSRHMSSERCCCGRSRSSITSIRSDREEKQQQMNTVVGPTTGGGKGAGHWLQDVHHRAVRRDRARDRPDASLSQFARITAVTNRPPASSSARWPNCRRTGSVRN